VERLSGSALCTDGNFPPRWVVLFLLGTVFYCFAPSYKPRLWITDTNHRRRILSFLIILIGGFTGMVLGLRVTYLRRFGFRGRALTVRRAGVLVRELGPRARRHHDHGARGFRDGGPSLGSMQSTEQIDALTVMAINPVQYLVSRGSGRRDQLPAATSIFDVADLLRYIFCVGLMARRSGAPTSTPVSRPNMSPRHNE